MNITKRATNEREYPNWKELENGGRLYWRDIPSKDGSSKIARYEKIVDVNENTVSFTQKILNAEGKILEIHEKFPINKGHIILFLLILVSITTFFFIHL